MARQRFSCDEGYLHANPFLAKPSHPDDLNTSDMEPISMIDEEEFVRKFRDIALFAEVDDVEDDAVLLRATCTTTNLFFLSSFNMLCAFFKILVGSRRKSDQHIQHKNFLASHQEESKTIRKIILTLFF